MASADIVSIITPLIGLGGAIFAGSGLFFTARTFRLNTETLRLNTRSRYVDILKQLQDELNQLVNSDDRNKHYENFGVNYLNSIERIAYLVIKEYIPKEIAAFFKPAFASALAMLTIDVFKKYAQGYEYLRDWCEMQGIEPRDPVLPYKQEKSAPSQVTCIYKISNEI